MNVLFVLWDGTLGGAETHTVRLCSLLRETRRIDARVCLVSDGGRLRYLAHDNCVPFVEMGAKSGPDSIGRWRQVRQLLRAWEPDVIVVGAYGLPYLPFYWAAGRARIVVVQHAGQFANPYYGFWKRMRDLETWMRPVCARHTTAEIAVSRYMMTRQACLPHGRYLTTVRNGVDTSVFRPADSAPSQRKTVQIAAAGRLVPGKGFEDLIDAIALLSRLTPVRCALSIAGDGPLLRQLRSRARAAGVENSVTFRGSVLDMAAYWVGHDIACIPSAPQFLETFGLTAAEAQACGLPTVVTENGALPEIIADGTTGFVVPAGSARHLAAALQHYVERPDLRARHGEAARARALGEYSLEAAAAGYARLFCRLTGAKTHSPLSCGVGASCARDVKPHVRASFTCRNGAADDWHEC